MDLTKLLRLLDLQTFVAFDFETTGLDPSHDKIIEFAAVRFRNGELEDSLSTFINPQIPIPPEITNITGITDEMVSKAPGEDEVIRDIVDFLDFHPIVAHNIDFDLGFLKQLKSKYLKNDSQISNLIYDTLFLAQSFLFFLPNHQLGTVSTFFGFSREGEHRALPDTKNVGYIFLRLIEEVSSYPLQVIQRILSVLKEFPVSTKALFMNLANYMVKENLPDRGIIQSRIEKKLNSNLFVHRGKSRELPEKAKEVFGQNGLFAKMMEKRSPDDTFFEVRSSQIEYADFINNIFSEGAIGITEAGTGLGKSLAYLFPGLRFALHSKKGPTIFSCYTKHLQDQLFFQEIPKLAEALDVSFSTTLLKGRGNYLCKTRLNRLIEEAGNLLSPFDAQSLIAILVWLSWTKTGDFDECPGFLNRRSIRVKEFIQSETGFCTRQLCSKHKGCFLSPLREAIRRAHLVVVNHSLLLSELSNPGILPTISRVIIDEAHNFGNIAYDFFQISLHYQGIRRQLIYADRQSKRSRRLKSQIDGIGKSHPEIAKQFARVQDSIHRMLVASDQFFTELSFDHTGNYEKSSPYSQKNRYKSFEKQFESTIQTIRELVRSFKSGLQEIRTIVRTLKGLPEESVEGEMVITIERLSESVEEILSQIITITLEQRKDWVYWEEGKFVDGELVLSLNGVPIDIGENLVEILFHPLDSVVLTSATLRIGDSFEYINSRLGLNEISKKKIYAGTFPSPFEYDEQCRYFQWAGILSPDSNEFPGLLTDVIDHIHRKWGKRTLVLFTARILLEKCYHEIISRGLAGKINLFAQHTLSSRTSLLRGFKNSSDGILLGTRSFWEGVDLPRDLLEILIVTKLPFDVPTDPVIEAYNERIQEGGGNAFLEHSVPEAAMKLRQGFGRLIRSTYDEGVFINMDNRVVKKRYGLYFQQAIPVTMRPFQELSDV